MSTSVILLLWMANMVCDTCGQLAFKAAAVENRNFTGWAYWRHMLRRPWIYVGSMAYILEFAVWLAFLSVVTLPEGVLLCMVNTVLVMVGGRLLFKEHFTRHRIIGVCLILGGVALVGMGR